MQYFVLFFVDDKIVDTDFYDASDEAFSASEIHADRGDCDSRKFDSVVFEVVDGLPVHIRSY